MNHRGKSLQADRDFKKIYFT